MQIDSSRLFVAIGANVKRLRKEAAYTQEDLASKSGLTRTSITNLEAGRQKVTIESLFSVAEALDVEMGDLLPSRDELRVGGSDEIGDERTRAVLEELRRGEETHVEQEG